MRDDDDTRAYDILYALHRGFYTSVFFLLVASIICVQVLFDGKKLGWKYFTCVIFGLAAGVLMSEAAEYGTSRDHPIARYVARSARFGETDVIARGLPVAMIATITPSAILVIALLSCYNIAEFYGVSVAAVGALSVAAINVANAAYAPIVDSAATLAEADPDCPEDVLKRTDLLDEAGNSFTHNSRGLALGTTVLTAVSLANAFVASVPVSCVVDGVVVTHCLEASAGVNDVHVLAGMLIGATLAITFTALPVLAVRRTASAVVGETQRQLEVIPGLRAGVEGALCEVGISHIAPHLSDLLYFLSFFNHYVCRVRIAQGQCPPGTGTPRTSRGIYEGSKWSE